MLSGESKESMDWISFYKEHCIYLPAMAGWFIFSALLSSYNKIVFGNDGMAFPCPLLMTSIHFFVQWITSYTLSQIFPQTFGGDQVEELSWERFISISLPCGIVTALDIGLSNLSLVRISITFYTMVKSSSPIFVLFWANLFGIETITWTLLAVVSIIAIGEFLTVIGEVKFDLIGFIQCLLASILSGMRWTVVQYMLQKTLNMRLRSSIAAMRIFAPSMFFCMIILSMTLEHPWLTLFPSSTTTTTTSNITTTTTNITTMNTTNISNISDSFLMDDNEQQQQYQQYQQQQEDIILMLKLGFIGAFLAICMLLCEFYLIMKSNAMVLMIGGVIKELITIMVGVFAFKDELNYINAGGCFVVFLGVILYKVSIQMGKTTSIIIDNNDDYDDDDATISSDTVQLIEVKQQQPQIIDDIDDNDDDDDSYVVVKGMLINSQTYKVNHTHTHKHILHHHRPLNNNSNNNNNTEMSQVTTTPPQTQFRRRKN